MNKKFTVVLGVFVVICAAVIIINLIIAFREKNNFSPASLQANTTAIQKEVSSEDNTTIAPQRGDAAVEKNSKGQPFLLN